MHHAAPTLTHSAITKINEFFYQAHRQAMMHRESVSIHTGGATVHVAMTVPDGGTWGAGETGLQLLSGEQ